MDQDPTTPKNRDAKEMEVTKAASPIENAMHKMIHVLNTPKFASRLVSVGVEDCAPEV